MCVVDVDLGVVWRRKVRGLEDRRGWHWWYFQVRNWWWGHLAATDLLKLESGLTETVAAAGDHDDDRVSIYLLPAALSRPVLFWVVLAPRVLCVSMSLGRWWIGCRRSPKPPCDSFPQALLREQLSSSLFRNYSGWEDDSGWSSDLCSSSLELPLSLSLSSPLLHLFCHRPERLPMTLIKDVRFFPSSCTPEWCCSHSDGDDDDSLSLSQ